MDSTYNADQLGDIASTALGLGLAPSRPSSPPQSVSLSHPEDHTSTRPFRFIDLPRELRNRIYDWLSPDTRTLVLRRSGRLITASKHPLELTSRQLAPNG